MKDRYILAFETSCDETSVAVLKNDDELLSNVIASQIESHKRFGGVVPEVASRHHVEVITACIEEAPVSYTHLDVYKRQLSVSLSCLPWLFLPLVNLHLEWAHNLSLIHIFSLARKEVHVLADKGFDKVHRFFVFKVHGCFRDLVKVGLRILDTQFFHSDKHGIHVTWAVDRWN